MSKETGNQVIRAYHWTQEKNLSGITTPNGSGLQPNTLIGRVEWKGLSKISEEIHGPYIFCFLASPYPREWQKYPEAYRQLIRNKSHIFSFDILDSDSAFVLDFGFALPYLRDNSLPGFLSSPECKKYIESTTPLSKYTGDYALPELVIMNPVAEDRLRLIDASRLISKALHKET